MPVPYLAYFDPQRVCDDCAQYATPPPFIVGSFVFPFLHIISTSLGRSLIISPHRYVPTFSRAAPVVRRDAERVGLDKTPSAQAEQLDAIDEIVAMLQGAEDTLLLARCGVVKLLTMLATLPLEQVSACIGFRVCVCVCVCVCVFAHVLGGRVA